MINWDTLEGSELNIAIARLLGYYIIKTSIEGSDRYILATPSSGIYPDVPFQMIHHDSEMVAWTDGPNFCGSLQSAEALRRFVERFDPTSGYAFYREETRDRNAAYHYRPPSPYGMLREYSAETNGLTNEGFALVSCRLVGKLLDQGVIKALPM